MRTPPSVLGGPGLAEGASAEVLVQDSWASLPREVQGEFLARRAALTDPAAFGRMYADRRWLPLRPVVLEEAAYRHLESVVARLLELAVDSCRRRASTLGELHQALGFAGDLPLMDPGATLVASELTRCARPDVLIERGKPRVVELNVGARLGGVTLASRMAAGFAGLVPEAGLAAPRPTATARSEAMVRVLGGQVGDGIARRVVVPSYWTVDDTGRPRHNNKVKKLILEGARRAGFHVVQTDLDQLGVDATGRLLAAGLPVDLVLIPWGSGEPRRMVDARAGFAAICGADRVGTVELFPRTESTLINSKVVLAWLHEDCDAGLLTPSDEALVRNHVPRTTALGLGGAPGAVDGGCADVVVKPALGKAGNGVLFGRRTSRRDWRAAVAEAAQEAPVVLQQRVEPDRVPMAFLDRVSGQRVSARVPFLLSPFMVDRAAADVAVRHMTPEVLDHDVVIAVDRGGCWNTVLLRA